MEVSKMNAWSLVRAPDLENDMVCMCGGGGGDGGAVPELPGSKVQPYRQASTNGGGTLHWSSWTR